MKVDEILQDIDDATLPPMSKEDAIDFLEGIQLGLDSRIEALHEEIDNETDGEEV